MHHKFLLIVTMALLLSACSSTKKASTGQTDWKDAYTKLNEATKLSIEKLTNERDKANDERDSALMIKNAALKSYAETIGLLHDHLNKVDKKNARLRDSILEYVGIRGADYTTTKDDIYKGSNLSPNDPVLIVDIAKTFEKDSQLHTLGAEYLAKDNFKLLFFRKDNLGNLSLLKKFALTPPAQGKLLQIYNPDNTRPRFIKNVDVVLGAYFDKGLPIAYDKDLIKHNGLYVAAGAKAKKLFKKLNDEQKKVRLMEEFESLSGSLNWWLGYRPL